MNSLFASLYELIFWDDILSPLLYSDSKYSVYGIIGLVTALAFAAFYYKGLDRPKFTSRGTWFLVLLLCLGANFGIVYAMVDPIAAQNNLGTDVSLGVSFAHTVWALVFFLTASVGLKFTSVNHSKIPF